MTHRDVSFLNSAARLSCTYELNSGYLKRFDIEFLKIDKSYVQSMGTQKDVLILCESIIQMAHKLGIQVIAEGIETEQQLVTLKSLGCNYGQGYLFSKPLPVEDFDLFVENRKN